MDSPCIVCIGSINVDFQMRAARLPRWHEVAAAHDLLIEGGGKAANVACCAALLGAATRLVARVGDDRLSALALGGAGRAGVDLRYTRVKTGMQTGVAMIVTGPQGRTSTVAVPNANAAWGEEEVEDVESAILSAPDGSIVFADLAASADAVSRAIATAHERGLPIVVDPSPSERYRALAGRADCLTPDAADTGPLTGITARTSDDGFNAAAALRAEGVRQVFVKLADGGCCVDGDADRFLVRAPRGRPVDRNGAGDAFAAALAVALLQRQPLRSAAVLAVAAATMTMSRYGGQLSYPHLDELLAFTRERMPSVSD